ncbi:hypothetical protein GCM10007859_27380 [Brevundimonas denitrificans]|uniref:Uncharacterized protein n=1 Tax=Brevundimonas denitrificans TaxID=1443434 RepID=A0ABQ6BR46_9CAUL|nr:hypothetical protein [Brevundimonas denitrificans]GLS02707.1 hypothetical protein GCM10007859_27380 [Brevundimonas denitrificans]
MKFVAAYAAVALGLAAVSPVLAQEAEGPPSGPIEIIRATDAAMTCAAVSEEAAQLSEAMGGEPDGGLFGRLGDVARAGAAMVIPGAGLAIAGADVLTAPGRERKEAEAAAVRHRWYYLNGLYAGQGCQAAADAAGPTPATPADAAPVVVPGP